MPIRLVIACALILLSTNAFAQRVSNAPKEIKGYRTLSVDLMGKVKDCYIDNTDSLSKHAAAKLKSIGISEDPASIVQANVTFSGQSFGVGNTQCILVATLNLTTMLNKDNFVTENQRVRAAIDRLKTIPISLWHSTTYVVAPLVERANLDGTNKLPPSTKGREAAARAVDRLVEHLKSFKNKS